MHSDSTIKMDNVNALLQTDPNLAGIPLTSVNNLSLNNIGEMNTMNMVMGLGRLDLSNIQQQQQFNQSQLNQLNQAQLAQAQLNQAQLSQAQLAQAQLNQAQLNQAQLNQAQYGQLNAGQLGQEPSAQPDLSATGGLLIQQQQAQTQTVPTVQQPQLQPSLPGYFTLSNNVTPLAGSNLRPIVLTDHNNNALSLANLNRAFDRSQQLLSEQLTGRSGLISPSTQSETSTNTQISKKIGIRVGSPEMEFKCWTLPRHVNTQPLNAASQTANIRYTPNTQLLRNDGSYASQFANQASLMSARKQFDAQQFASQILYSKQNRLDAESPQSNSQPDLLIDHTQQSITPTPVNLQQQQLYGQYYPLQLNQADLPNYAKFCYETATHKYYTIPGSLRFQGFRVFGFSD